MSYYYRAIQARRYLLWKVVAALCVINLIVCKVKGSHEECVDRRGERREFRDSRSNVTNDGSDDRCHREKVINSRG